MKDFALLYRRLDETTKTNEKLAAMAQYFDSATPSDAAWAVYFLSGRRLKRLVKIALLRQLAREVAKIPGWMFEECYGAVGDLAETISLLVPSESAEDSQSLAETVEEEILGLKSQPEETQRDIVLAAWERLDSGTCFVWNKLITGGFRVGVSQRLVIRALSQLTGLEPSIIAHRLMGNWNPTEEFYARLTSLETEATAVSLPYPFYLAYPLEGSPEELGKIEDWQLEWKWDGIRAQLIVREGEVFLWSRGEEMIGDRFPEIREAAAGLPDGTVIDGEVLAWKERSVLPFSKLQKRIGLKKPSAKMLVRIPAVLMAYDLVEVEGKDIRKLPLSARRGKLESVLQDLRESVIMPSPLVSVEDWVEAEKLRQSSRSRSVEGFMLKQTDSPYRTGRKRGDWWKWKVDPYTADAVLIYAQRGHGRRASLYSDYTFAVWKGDELVPFAKAYSGLTDKEIREVDRFVRTHTTDRFGRVRAVDRELVFEIAFENIQPSNRHKSGLAVRFPRINRWRRDKKPKDADTIEMIRGLLATEEIP